MPQQVETQGEAGPTGAGTQAAESDAAAEHLAHLHRMSTTAGVTNQDYVAVNPLAVVAALLGLASGLAFLGWLLLVVPIVGIVFAMVAIRQINNSNGTQAGKGLAIVGLLLCLLCAAGVGVREGLDYAARRSDERAIATSIQETGRLLRSGEYQQAYAHFDPDFHQRVGYDQFQRTWSAIQGGYLGKLEKMEWNQISPAFQSGGGTTMAVTKARVKFEKGQEERFDVILRKVDDKWLINGLPQIFRAPPGQQQQQQDVFNL